MLIISASFQKRTDLTQRMELPRGSQWAGVDDGEELHELKLCSQDTTDSPSERKKNKNKNLFAQLAHVTSTTIKEF